MYISAKPQTERQMDQEFQIFQGLARISRTEVGDNSYDRCGKEQVDGATLEG